MRLTLVTETFPPEVNGVAMTLGRWLAAFEARGHSVRVIRPRQSGEVAAPDRVSGWSLPFYQEVHIGYARAGQIQKILLDSATDLVHIATEGPLGWAALRAARNLGLPVASSFHTNFDYYAGHYHLGVFEKLARAYLRQFHNRCAVTLVPSEGTRQRLRNQGFERVEIWSRGVDADLFSPDKRNETLRQSLGLGGDDLLLLYVGRLAQEKNLPVLIEAFARFRQQFEAGGRKVRLALVGGGPLEGSLRQQQPAGIYLAGVQRGEDLARWYASADLFAFPSCSETFGNVVLEAQASGLPVAAYNCPGVNERVHPGEDGLLVPAGSDFAQPLALLAEAGEMRQRMGRMARQRAAEQGWDRIFDALERRYIQLFNAQPAQLAPARGMMK